MRGQTRRPRGAKRLQLDKTNHIGYMPRRQPQLTGRVRRHFANASASVPSAGASDTGVCDPSGEERPLTMAEEFSPAGGSPASPIRRRLAGQGRADELPGIVSSAARFLTIDAKPSLSRQANRCAGLSVHPSPQALPRTRQRAMRRVCCAPSSEAEGEARLPYPSPPNAACTSAASRP